MPNKIILQSLVGSQAHGLATPDSDFDYRGVFIVPTSDILKLNSDVQSISWIEGKVDNTSYELAHFLHLAMQSNSSVLEVLVSPKEVVTPIGQELIALLPYLWSSNGVLNAFRGYAHNQRKKFIEDKDERPWKFAVAQIRTLLLGIELLKYGTMTVNVKEQGLILKGFTAPLSLSNPDSMANHATLSAMKERRFQDKGFVVDWANQLEKELVKAYEANWDHKNDPDKVNEFLLKVRRENW